VKMDVDGDASAGGFGIAVLDRMQQQPPPPDPALAMQQMIGNFQVSLMEAERNREVARQIERADERSHHRVRDEQLAQMTAFNGRMFQDLASRPTALPAAIAPQMISNVNIQNVTPINYVTNLQANLFQSTQNLHKNTLNFINNTSNKILAMGGSLADKYKPDEEVLQPVMNGGPPPPPPGGMAIRDREGPYTPSTSGASSSGLNGGPGPSPSGTGNPLPISGPKAIKDKPIVIKKPTIIKRPVPKRPIIMDEPKKDKDKKPPIIMDEPKKGKKPPIIIVDTPRPKPIIDAPRRVRPQKNRELLEILDAFGDAPPSKRPKQGDDTLALREPFAVRIRNRLKIRPA